MAERAHIPRGYRHYEDIWPIGLSERLRMAAHCAHPEYRELLMSYLTIVEGGHKPNTLSAAFRMHEQFQ